MSASAPPSLRSALASVATRPGRRHDLVRPLRQVEQRTVDVEKDRERRIAQGGHILP